MQYLFTIAWWAMGAFAVAFACGFGVTAAIAAGFGETCPAGEASAATNSSAAAYITLRLRSGQAWFIAARPRVLERLQPVRDRPAEPAADPSAHAAPWRRLRASRHRGRRDRHPHPADHRARRDRLAAGLRQLQGRAGRPCSSGR